MEPFTLTRLAKSDAAAVPPVDAMAYVRLSDSFCCTRPAAFRCSDGHTYWVKVEEAVPGALTYELIAGRLGELTGFAPPAAVVVVPPEALPTDGSENRFRGVGVGVRDVPNTVNFDGPQNPDLIALFRSIHIDNQSWLETAVFHTWLGMADAQVLVGLKSGHLCSIDHERAFMLFDGNTPGPIVKILCEGAQPTKDRDQMRQAISRVEAITDEQLLWAVAATPGSFPTLLDRATRLRIAAKLAARRDRLRAVMEAWVDS